MRPLVLVAVAVLLAGCSDSPASLRDRVDDKPGVVRVDVQENDGDNDIPFATVPKHVAVRMEADASADEVMAVFDAYDDPIADGEVGSVDLVLAGPKRATLSSGEGIHVPRDLVEELVAAQADDSVLDYRREAYPVLPGVEVELAPAGFAEVVAFADRYADAADLEYLGVSSGDFVLIRDTGNEEPRITAEREAFALMVDARFGLLGASVSGRGRLELTVSSEDEAAVRRLVDGQDDPEVGNVVVASS